MTAIPLPAGLQGYLRRRDLPPVEEPTHCGDSLMRIAPDGTWFHHGAGGSFFPFDAI
jgi:hypothetical protein